MEDKGRAVATYRELKVKYQNPCWPEPINSNFNFFISNLQQNNRH
jgi:hypothetical protein